MAKMYITEYRALARDGKGHVMPAGLEPAVANQAVTFTGTAGQSAAFNEMTAFVRIFCDADACIKFGLNPTAVDGTDTGVNAEAAEFFGLDPDYSSIKVSAVTRT